MSFFIFLFVILKKKNFQRSGIQLRPFAKLEFFKIIKHILQLKYQAKKKFRRAHTFRSLEVILHCGKCIALR